MSLFGAVLHRVPADHLWRATHSPFSLRKPCQTLSSPSRQFPKRTFVSRLCQFVMQSRYQKKLIEAPQTECIVESLWNQTRSLTGRTQCLTGETRSLIGGTRSLIQLDGFLRTGTVIKKTRHALRKIRKRVWSCFL